MRLGGGDAGQLCPIVYPKWRPLLSVYGSFASVDGMANISALNANGINNANKAYKYHPKGLWNHRPVCIVVRYYSYEKRNRACSSETLMTADPFIHCNALLLLSPLPRHAQDDIIQTKRSRQRHNYGEII